MYILGPDSQSKVGVSVVFPALMRCSYKDERPAWAVQPARLQESGFHVTSSLIWGAAHNGSKWLAGPVYPDSVHRALTGSSCPAWPRFLCASSEEGVADIPHSPLGDSYPFFAAFSLVL